MRLERNKIIHSSGNNISKNHTETIKLLHEILETIFSTYSLFFPEKHWIDERLAYIEKSPESAIYGNEYSTNILCREIDYIIKLLPPSFVKKLFDVNKKARKYLCPHCLSLANRKIGFEIRLAELVDDKKSVKCAVCRRKSDIFYSKCSTINCDGHFFSSTERVCLSCGHDT
jgi:hypothetical protein